MTVIIAVNNHSFIRISKTSGITLTFLNVTRKYEFYKIIVNLRLTKIP